MKGEKKSKQDISSLSLGHYLTNRHGAKDVQEDEGAVIVIIPWQVTMGQSLDP